MIFKWVSFVLVFNMMRMSPNVVFSVQAPTRQSRNEWVRALIHSVQRAITEAELLVQNREMHRQRFLERRMMTAAAKGAPPVVDSLIMEPSVSRARTESTSVSLSPDNAMDDIDREKALLSAAAGNDVVLQKAEEMDRMERRARMFADPNASASHPPPSQASLDSSSSPLSAAGAAPVTSMLASAIAAEISASRAPPDRTTYDSSSDDDGMPSQTVHMRSSKAPVERSMSVLSSFPPLPANREKLSPSRTAPPIPSRRTRVVVSGSGADSQSSSSSPAGPGSPLVAAATLTSSAPAVQLQRNSFPSVPSARIAE